MSRENPSSYPSLVPPYVICDPRTARKTCANCILYCDASIKFACSKFPKPCYESVNFEICCRSIIMDGFRYNCAGSVSTVYTVSPKLACRGRETASIKATDELQRQQQWLPSVEDPLPSLSLSAPYRYLYLYLYRGICICISGSAVAVAVVAADASRRLK